MIFFDERNPNKYRRLKKLITPLDLNPCASGPTKKVKVGKGDGGYVVDNPNRFDTVLSYGIGNDPQGVSFETECLNNGCRVHMYDGSIDKFPLDFNQFGGLPCFFSEYVTKHNFKNHVKKINPHSLSTSVLKMDIEGHEYDWLTEENLEILAENFGQFAIEVHSLIEEVPENWVLESQLKEAKENPEKVIKFFENINEKFYLWHLHGNNHAPRYVDFPDSLELTYINKKLTEYQGIDYSNYPIENLDEPNYNGREDYVLDWWK